MKCVLLLGYCSFFFFLKKYTFFLRSLAQLLSFFVICTKQGWPSTNRYAHVHISKSSRWLVKNHYLTSYLLTFYLFVIFFSLFIFVSCHRPLHLLLALSISISCVCFILFRCDVYFRFFSATVAAFIIFLLWSSRACTHIKLLQTRKKNRTWHKMYAQCWSFFLC